MKTKIKIIFLSLFMIFITSFTIHSMNEQQQFIHHDIEFIKNILVGNAILNPGEQIFFSSNLAPEIASKIASYLFMYQSAQSLTEAGKVINTLAQVNHELNELINNSHFCFMLIKYLANVFNCSDEIATKALQTKEAQERLLVQKLFEQLFVEEKFDEQQFNNIYAQYKNYVDLNFTYKGHTEIDIKASLLLFAANDNKNEKTKKINWLLRTNIINVNHANTFGVTALMITVLGNEPRAVYLLCNHPLIDLNKRNNQGDTAIMCICKMAGTKLFNILNLQILLDMGADPEIPNISGTTPLQMVELFDNEDAIFIIEEAIDRKYNKK